MKRYRSPPARIQAGFTLVEMLVVLAIIALCASIGLGLARPPSQSLQLQADTRKLCGALRLARAQAIAKNDEVALRIDAKERHYRTSDLDVVQLSSDTNVTVTFAVSERGNQTDGVFRFYPTGGSTGGEIELSKGNVASLISVNWLTGEARCSN